MRWSTISPPRAEANIDRFCHQSGRLAFPTKGDVSQLHMKGGGEIVLHLIEGDQTSLWGGKTTPAIWVEKPVDIASSPRQFSDPLHADEIVLNDGTLNLSPHSADLPFAADRLMLRNMAFNSPETGWALSAQRVTGGVSPWTPEAGNVLGKTAQIQISGSAPFSPAHCPPPASMG